MTFLGDLRAAIRLWIRRPGVPTLAVLFLASGMGMAGGIFAVADAALWRSLPLPGADRVVWVQSVDRGDAGDTSPGVFAAWSDRARTLSEVGALRPVAATLRDGRGAERLDGAQATSGVFSALGVTATLGRPLIADDERAGADPVVVLTHRLWQSRFGGDPSIVGRQVDLDGRSRRIAGVLEANADLLPVGGDWFTPLPLSPDALSPGGPRYLKVVGRMVATGDLLSTSHELTVIAQSIGAVGSDGALLGAHARPFGQAFAGTSARLLQPLFITSLIVLLIAAMNTATLLMRRPAHAPRRAGRARRPRRRAQPAGSPVAHRIAARRGGGGPAGAAAGAVVQRRADGAAAGGPAADGRCRGRRADRGVRRHARPGGRGAGRRRAGHPADRRRPGRRSCRRRSGHRPW